MGLAKFSGVCAARAVGYLAQRPERGRSEGMKLLIEIEKTSTGCSRALAFRWTFLNG
jgi:hypothetical protein